MCQFQFSFLKSKDNLFVNRAQSLGSNPVQMAYKVWKGHKQHLHLLHEYTCSFKTQNLSLYTFERYPVLWLFTSKIFMDFGSKQSHDQWRFPKEETYSPISVLSGISCVRELRSPWITYFFIVNGLAHLVLHCLMAVSLWHWLFQLADIWVSLVNCAEMPLIDFRGFGSNKKANAL